jgi:hypothetical protein
LAGDAFALFLAQPGENNPDSSALTFCESVQCSGNKDDGADGSHSDFGRKPNLKD